MSSMVGARSTRAARPSVVWLILLAMAAVVCVPAYPVVAEGSAIASPGPGASAEPSLPVARSSQANIAEALAAGRIDYPTSLLYRAYAMVDDPQLPAEYQGNAAAEDAVLFDEIARAGASLPAAIRAKLIPYTVRPTDPRSIQSLPPVTADGRAAPGRLALMQRPLGGAAVGGASTGAIACDRLTGWASRENPVGYKVWSQCTGDYSADINRVYGLLGALWPRETALMGEPDPDAGGDAAGNDVAGGDGAIDVYLVERWQCAWREHQCNKTVFPVRDKAGKLIRNSDALGMAFATGPFEGPAAAQRASGYMLIARVGLATNAGLEGTLAHEFFHILGFAHNWGGAAYGDPLVNHWLVESSAEWAGWYFTTERSHEHSFFANFMATEDIVDAAQHKLTSTPLDIPSPDESNHAYAAWVWQLFLQMESGGPAAIAAEWRAVEGLSGKRDWDGALDGRFSFASHLRDFAVRNINLDLEPGDVLAPRYPTLDSGLALAGVVIPGELDVAPMSEDSPKIVPMNISRLGSTYLHYSFTKDVRQIRVDPSGLAPDQDLDVDALVKVKDHWERRRLSTGLTRFCRPGDDVAEMYLVFTNHGIIDHSGFGSPAEIDGSVKMTALDAPCTGVNGTITWTYHSDYSDAATWHTHDVVDNHVSLDLRFENKDAQWVDAGSSYSISGTEHETDDGGTCSPLNDSSSWTNAGTFAAAGDVSSIDFQLDADSALVGALVGAELHGHKSFDDGNGLGQCDHYEQDYSQSASDWGALVGCGPDSDAVIGKLSDDGTSADFTCTYTETVPVNTGMQTTTWQVSGALSLGP